MTDTQKKPYDIRAVAQERVEVEGEDERQRGRHLTFERIRMRRAILMRALKPLKIPITECDLVHIEKGEIMEQFPHPLDALYIAVIRYDGLTLGLKSEGSFEVAAYHSEHQEWISESARHSIPVIRNLTDLGHALEYLEAINTP